MSKILYHIRFLWGKNIRSLRKRSLFSYLHWWPGPRVHHNPQRIGFRYQLYKIIKQLWPYAYQRKETIVTNDLVWLYLSASLILAFLVFVFLTTTSNSIFKPGQQISIGKELIPYQEIYNEVSGHPFEYPIMRQELRWGGDFPGDNLVGCCQVIFSKKLKCPSQLYFLTASPTKVFWMLYVYHITYDFFFQWFEWVWI